MLDLWTDAYMVQEGRGHRRLAPKESPSVGEIIRRHVIEKALEVFDNGLVVIVWRLVHEA